LSRRCYITVCFNKSVNLAGGSFSGTTSQTARLRTSVITVDHSAASTIYGIHSFGTGTPDESESAIRALTVTVKSVGLRNKRA
jgi:hypothetical protein